MVKIKELIEQSSVSSASSSSLSSSDPYSLFLYAMNSPVTRDRYTTRLNRFFSFIGIEGTTIEERCRIFVERNLGRKLFSLVIVNNTKPTFRSDIITGTLAPVIVSYLLIVMN
jgi:hypothetical protein